MHENLVEIRHWLHAHPELSFQEFGTTAFLREQIEALGIEILSSSGLPTGFVDRIGAGKPVVALRADIDGLPVQEADGLEYASVNSGVMHACGHDLHMASLLGAARELKARELTLAGTIKLIFQPAEEIGAGADTVLASGLVDDVEAFIGWHNIPTLGTGVIGLREKGVMAAVERFKVILTGLGSHAAYPHEGRDPVVALSAIVQGLQSIVARNVPVLESAVVSVTHVEAGSSWNVLPDTAWFEGTIRTFDTEVRALVKLRFAELIEHTAAAFGVTAEIDWVMSADLTYNEPAFVATLREVFPGAVIPEPSSAGEDFANYRRQAPGIFALIGSNEVGSAGLHQAELVVKDEVLLVAVDYYIKSTERILRYLKEK